MSKTKVTLEDVARTAGVSPSTVSRVINRSTPVSQELNEKVESAIGRLGFKGPKVEAMGNMGPFSNFLLLVGKVESDVSSCPR